MKKSVTILAALMMVACSSVPKTDSAAAQSNPSQVSDKDAALVAAASSAPVSAESLELSQMKAELEALQSQSNFFDYKKYEIKPEYLDIIKKQAEFLKAHANDVVTLQGHADERGGVKYNFELGNKRAKGGQQKLGKDGVSGKQIQVVSLGKTQPRLSCHEEKCWKENRRVDFQHRT